MVQFDENRDIVTRWVASETFRSVHETILLGLVMIFDNETSE